jgi:hypothetical protein
MPKFVDEKTGPYFGFALALLGTYLAAFVLFPVDPAPRGALTLSGTVLAFFIMVVPIVRVVYGSALATSTENFVCFGFVAWLLLDLIQGAYLLEEASPRGLQLALVATGVSAACMWLGVAHGPWRLPAWLTDGASRQLSTQTLYHAVPICFLLGMFNFAYAVDFDIPEMFSYLGVSRWDAPWGRGQSGGWEAFRDQTPYFGYVLPSLTALTISRLGLFRFQSLLSISCSLVMLAFLAQGGGRRIIAVTVGAGLLVWLQANPGVRLKNYIIVGIGAVALAAFAQFMLNARGVGFGQYEGEDAQYDVLHVDDNFLRLAQIIDLVPAKRSHVGIQQVVFTLVRPVPRVLWPGKPMDSGFDLPSEVGLRGVSLSSSIVGEWYLAFGWLSVLLGGWLHGRLSASANTLREIGHQSGNPIVFALAVMVLLAGMRSMLELVLMSYAVGAWWAVNHQLTKRQS